MPICYLRCPFFIVIKVIAKTQEGFSLDSVTSQRPKNLFENSNGKMVFAKLKKFFAKLILFPPKNFCSKRFPFSKLPKKSFGGKKINLAKKVGGPIKMKKKKNRKSRNSSKI
jgi:hypothetical protein